MKGSQKIYHSNSTDCVIAKLMGFDELPSQQPDQYKSRVLSDNCMVKAASTSRRPASLISIGRLRKTRNEIVGGVQIVSRARSSNGMDGHVLDKRGNSSSHNALSSVRSSKPARSSVSKLVIEKSEHFAAGSVLRHQQKLGHDHPFAGHLLEPGVNYVSSSLNFTFEMKDRPHSELKLKLDKVAHDLEDIKFGIHSRAGYKELRIGKPDAEVVNGTVPNRHSCVTCTRNMSRISPPERRRSKFEHVLNSKYKDYGHNPHLLADKSSLANKSRKRNSEGWNTVKNVQVFGVPPRNQTLNEILALTDKTSIASNLGTSLCSNDSCSPFSLQSRSSDPSSPSSLQSGSSYSSRLSVFSKSEVLTTLQKDISEPKFGSEAYIQGNEDEIDDCFKNDRCGNFEPSQRSLNSSFSNLAPQSIYDASFKNEEAFNAKDCSRINDDPLSNSYHRILLEEGVHEEVFSGEASLNGFSNEESTHSECSGIIHPVSQENLKRTSQHSPDSVLESHDIKHCPSYGCFDSRGLMLQLQALNFESEETFSEGSAIIVSGDEDLEERLGVSLDGRKFKRWLGDEESRNFSYMVDVLDEAGFYDMSSFMDFNKWATLDCPINPMVFDVLEKKYGKQTSWKKSERQLLFDSINSGLLSIYGPLVNFHAGAISICKRYHASFRRDEVEEKLWNILTSQENEKGKDISEKALDKWLEFNEGISIMCEELETTIFEELVIELASL